MADAKKVMIIRLTFAVLFPNIFRFQKATTPNRDDHHLLTQSTTFRRSPQLFDPPTHVFFENEILQFGIERAGSPWAPRVPRVPSCQSTIGIEILQFNVLGQKIQGRAQHFLDMRQLLTLLRS